MRPVLKPTAASVQDFLTWVAGELADGNLRDGTAKELNNSASKMLTAIKVDESMSEMDELRELVRRMESAVERKLENESKDRYAQGDELKHSFEVVR